MANRGGAKIALVAIAVLLAAVVACLAIFAGNAKDRTADFDAAAAPSPTPKPTMPPAPAASPTPKPTPEAFDRHEAVFRRGGKPATQVLARFGDGREETTRDDGTFARHENSPLVEVVDIPTSLVLARFNSPPPRARIQLPEPIRVAGHVSDDEGHAAPGASLRLGHGPRELAADRHRRRMHSEVMRAPNEDTPWGVAMPESSSLWTDLEVGSAGAFESGWIVADEIPQLIALDGRGRCAVVDVQLPRSLEPRSTVTTEVRLSPPTGIEVEVEFPDDRQPFPIALGFLDAEIDSDHLQEAGLLMSALDAMDPGLGRFAVGQGNVFVDRPGARLFAPLPPMSRAILVARGATSALVPQHQIEIPFGQITYVRFRKDELFPTISRRARFEGRIVLQGTGEPVPDALVVASWFREKRETSTDADGAFAFDGLPADQELRFFVQAYDVADPPRWSHSRTEEFDGLAENPTVVAWKIPGLYWIRVNNMPVREEAPPLVSLLRRAATQRWEPWRGAADFYFDGDVVEIEVPEPGSWRPVVQQSDFVFRAVDDVEVGRESVEATAALPPAEGVRERTMIVVRRADGSPASHIEGFVTPQLPGAQPVAVTANARGEIEIGPLNIKEAGLRIDGEHEAFESVVDLGGESVEVRLSEPR